MAPNSPKQDFLWVNKDAKATSLSSSDRAEKRRIFQFVQAQRIKPGQVKGKTIWRKTPNLIPRNADPRPIEPITQYNPAAIRRYRPLCIRPARNALPSPSDSISSQPSPKSRRPDSTINRSRAAYRDRQIPTTNYVPGSGVDPFNASPMPITKNVEVLIKYYCVMVSTGSHVDKAEVLPPHLQPTKRYADVRDRSLRAIMQSKVEFNSLMVIMAARMVHLSRIPLTEFARPEYYMHLSLAAVRERMLDFQSRGVPGDNVLVHGIHSLALADWICQRFEAASTHIRAVKVLLPLLDLEDSLDLHVSHGIFNVDKMVAIETGWLPELPLMFDPGPLDQARMLLIRKELNVCTLEHLEPVIYPHSPVPDASTASNAIMCHQIDVLADASTILDFSLGSGFERALATDGVIDWALAPILSDLLDVLTVAKYVWRTPKATREDADWMCKRARAICHRLLDLPAQLSLAETSPDAAKTEALRVALLLVVLRCTNRMSFRSAQPNMRRLQRSLCHHGIDTTWRPSSLGDSSCSTIAQQPPSPSANTERYDPNELLLWVLLTGHFNAQGESAEELWFLLRAAYVAERLLGLCDLEGLERVMGRYLYSKTQQRTSLMIVALHLSRP